MSQENQQHRANRARGFSQPIDWGFEDESDYIPRHEPQTQHEQQSNRIAVGAGQTEKADNKKSN